MPTDHLKVLVVAGARPNFMKVAPILRALEAAGHEGILVHTGQHYDATMSDTFFRELGIKNPDYHLGVGTASHAVQTARIMEAFEPVLTKVHPQWLVVVGDVNSTMATTLVASKLRTETHMHIAHVEAGLRSYDRDMPEEVNRVLTDQIADILYTTEREAAGNLAREGIAAERVQFVGNVMIDSLLEHRARAVAPAKTLASAGADDAIARDAAGFGVVTLHRPSNVDSPDALAEALDVLRAVATRLPLVWPVHPRARANIERFGFASTLASSRITMLAPQGYLEMVGLLANARLVLTDSGGIQEESTALSVPCLTMRENTERPITIAEGTNTLVGRDRALALACTDEILISGGKRGRMPALWDGHAADRIAAHLQGWLAARSITMARAT